MNFGKKIKNLRIKNNLTQSELGKILNVTKPTISKYENNETEANFETIKKISEYFNVTFDYLFSENDGITTSNIKDEKKQVPHNPQKQGIPGITNINNPTITDLVEISKETNIKLVDLIIYYCYIYESNEKIEKITKDNDLIKCLNAIQELNFDEINAAKEIKKKGIDLNVMNKAFKEHSKKD